MPDTRPRVQFTDGVCNACLHADYVKTIDWDARKTEFLKTIDRFRRHQTYDCIVACSGGKDSASIAWRLKHEYGLNPLGVCYGQLLWTDVGRRNMERLSRAGIDIDYWRVNQDVSRKLARRFLIERGHPKNAYDSAVNSVPLRTAIHYNIPLVFFAEFGEAAYGGRVENEDSHRRRNLQEVLEHQVGDDARNWAVDGITERDLFPYIYPDLEDVQRVGVEAHYWSYYHPWDVWGNAELMRDKIGFEGVEPRSDGSFESRDSIDDKIDGIDYALMRVKFLFGRSIRMASRLIQTGRMTRAEGLELARKYDHEYPSMYLDEVLDYLWMTKPELDRVINSHRNPELWVKDGDQWRERYAPS